MKHLLDKVLLITAVMPVPGWSVAQKWEWLAETPQMGWNSIQQKKESWTLVQDSPKTATTYSPTYPVTAWAVTD
ncbi:MAG: hypothetical protein IJ154_06740 [Bacteroidales bacterium]|nr:hypothetical protein [Bacteroidales bacterium]